MEITGTDISGTSCLPSTELSLDVLWIKKPKGSLNPEVLLWETVNQLAQKIIPESSLCG